MKLSVRAGRSRTRATLGIAILAATVAVVALQTASAAPQAVGVSAAAHRCLVMTGSGDPAFTKNFNPYTAQGLPSGAFVRGAFYEPLLVATAAGGGHVYPWLAQSWKWSNGNKTLTLNIRKGVKWSDGKALDAADVVYSLTAGRQDPVADTIGLMRKGTNIVSIKQKGAYQVTINLRTPDSQFIPANLNLQGIYPKHIFSKVAKLATWTNPKPVGSGPFTSIARFTSQDYVLNKNPNYWLAGAPKVPCLEYVQASSNDAALLLTQSGKVDWTHNFVPNVEKAYGSKDPAHYHWFYSTTAYPQSLVFDTTQYPYSIVAFRKAVSQAINRDEVSKLGEYGYAPATDALGIGYIFPKWVTDPNVKSLAKQLATYNPTAAKKTLTDAGFTYSGNKLLDPKGNPVSFQIGVISGWSDWVASLNIIAKNLQAIGIDANVKLEPDWNSWYPNASATKYPHLMWQVASQGSAYGFFWANMHDNAKVPSGEDATVSGNWEHYSNPTATTLLDQWKVTLDPEKQQQLAAQLENLWLQNLPIVPLFVGPRWSTYSTKYFHCFTSPKNPYTDPIFTQFPDNVLSFTRICQGAQAGT